MDRPHVIRDQAKGALPPIGRFGPAKRAPAPTTVRPPTASSPPYRADLSTVLIMTLICLLGVRIILMAWLPLTDTTEARYAEIARKMLETGNWITPQFDYGVPFWGKPPLHTWMSASGMALFGVSAFAARLPILIAALGILITVYTFTCALSMQRTALIAVTVCASSVMFFGAAAFVMTDIPMVLGTTISMAGFYMALTARSGHPVWGYLFFLGLAVGLLAKGPTALVLTLLPCGIWTLLRRRIPDLARLPWKGGTVLTLLLVCPWYLAAEVSTPGFLRYFLIGEHVERFLIPDWQGDLYGTGHQEPKGMIWLFGLAVMLPWTPLTAALAVRSRIFGSSPDLATYLGLWILSPLLLFTGAANILPAYVLPAVPAFAIMTALMIRERQGMRWVRIATMACCITSLTFFAAVTFAARHAPALLSLRTPVHVLAVARTLDPAPQVIVYPRRSYAAEFYTRGKARTISDPAALSLLSVNETRDAVIVPNQVAQGALDLLGPAFSVHHSDHKNHLLIERKR